MAKTLPDDPAYALLLDDFTTTPAVFRKGCYICEDSEFAQMGLPLCTRCPSCGGHVPADDTVCDSCGLDELEAWEELQISATETAPRHNHPPES